MLPRRDRISSRFSVMALLSGVVAVSAISHGLMAADEPSKPRKAGERPSETTRDSSGNKPAKDSGKSPEPSLQFAYEHHPELAALLEQLKASDPQEYRAAIAELDAARERLERTRQKMPERFDLELAEWKVNSRIRLLAAKLAMSDEPVLEADLKAALKERVELRMQLQVEERERLKRRMEKLDDQIATQKRRVSETVDREFATFRKDAAAAKTAIKASKRESNKSSANKPPAKKTSNSRTEETTLEKSESSKSSSAAKPTDPRKPSQDAPERKSPR